MPYKPKFKYTSKMVLDLMGIEGAKEVVNNIPLPDYALLVLQHEAALQSTHYSTQIEGNILGLREVEKVARNKKNRLGHYEQEVRNYWNALIFLGEQAKQKAPITHDFIQKVHRTIEVRTFGQRGKKSPYRKEQNVIRGRYAYRPPKPEDVQGLMDDLVNWVESKTVKENLPVPVKAGIFSYQFLTIHPFMDGNGRTARALATYIFHRDGYDLKGIFSVEEQYARNLDAYYRNLQLGLPENYYEGRNDPDITSWLEYFVNVAAVAFNSAKEMALSEIKNQIREDKILENLDIRQRAVLHHFKFNKYIDSENLQSLIKKMTIETARKKLREWEKSGFLKCAGKEGNKKLYELGEEYRQAMNRPIQESALKELLLKYSGIQYP